MMNLLRTFFFTFTFTLISGLFIGNQFTFAAKSEALVEYEHDVVGNSKKHMIILSGIPFSNNSAFYKEIWATIDNKIKIEYRRHFSQIGFC